MFARSAAQFLVWIKQLLAVIEADIRKLHHDPSELLARMLQPAIWILIFGEAMRNTLSTTIPYLDYMAPGILAQSILIIAIFYGIALIWEKDMGVLHKMLVAPVPRVLLVVGRALAAGVRGLGQVIVVYILALLLSIDLHFSFFAVLGVLSMSVLLAALFSTFSLIVASLVKKRERFMGIGQAITMPLFFASNALYPIDIMPHWLRMVSLFNPLTYQVDAFRSLMIEGQESHFGLAFDFGVTAAVFALLVWIATKLYPKIVY